MTPHEDEPADRSPDAPEDTLANETNARRFGEAIGIGNAASNIVMVDYLLNVVDKSKSSRTPSN